MKVLVVDGRKQERGDIVDALACIADVAVVGAVGTIDSAMRALTELRADILVTGVELEDGPAIALLTKARSMSRPPWIVVVGHEPSRVEWRQHLDAGADRFVERDGELRELQDVVTALVARSRGHATEADEAMRLLGRLAAGVSHDLNNYMGAVGVLLELLAKAPHDPALWRETRSAMAQALRLVQAMLDYARNDDAPMNAVELGTLVRSTVALAQRAMPPNVEIALDANDHGPVVHGAVAELEQLVLNLVVNAADAMPAGGTAVVRVSAHGTEAVLEVIDGGTGIPVGVLEDPPPTRHRKRIGLGLGIVRRVVERHGGLVRFAARRDSPGTHVTVRLPTRGKR